MRFAKNFSSAKLTSLFDKKLLVFSAVVVTGFGATKFFYSSAPSSNPALNPNEVIFAK